MAKKKKVVKKNNFQFGWFWAIVIFLVVFVIVLGVYYYFFGEKVMMNPQSIESRLTCYDDEDCETITEICLGPHFCSIKGLGECKYEGDSYFGVCSFKTSDIERCACDQVRCGAECDDAHDCDDYWFTRLCNLEDCKCSYGLGRGIYI
ncbi:MAG: hypothetical protein ABIF88_03405 [archaeon]